MQCSRNEGRSVGCALPAASSGDLTRLVEMMERGRETTNEHQRLIVKVGLAMKAEDRYSGIRRANGRILGRSGLRPGVR